MLRLMREIHLVDPFDESKYANVRATDAERRNQGLKHLICFLFVLGAAA